MICRKCAQKVPIGEKVCYACELHVSTVKSVFDSSSAFKPTSDLDNDNSGYSARTSNAAKELLSHLQKGIKNTSDEFEN